MNSARQKARDARRLSDMRQIMLALELYYDSVGNGQYPGNSDNDCSGWDSSNNGDADIFINPLETSGIMSEVPRDPTGSGSCGGYRYYRYSAGSEGCDSSRGAFYVLLVVDMETSGSPHPDSPGWSCPNRDWQSGRDWVTGAFEG